MDSRMKLAEKVLEYWFTLEFLSQDSYPQKEQKEALEGAKSLKARILKGQKGYRSAFHFFEMEPREDIHDVLQREAGQCGMKEWGNLTVYVGKVRRESCIRCIAEKLPFENGRDERPEESFDDIACVSLQLTPEGSYVEHSLFLSTIVWAMKQLKNCTGRIADCLDASVYQSEVDELEHRFFGGKEEQEGPGPVNTTVLTALYEAIEKEYLRNCAGQKDGECPYRMIIGISVQMFADEDTKNKEEDDNYPGLSHDYFSNDLKLVLDKVRMEDQSISEDLLAYLCSTYEAAFGPEVKKRIDLVHPEDAAEYEGQVCKLLNIRNAPLGKWPSKFMPAFMQQMSINLAIQKGNSELFQENGGVFSVNGPPGTGKTTLLKEIVVNNIIERAILLAEYDNPDDAFDVHSFLHGPKQNNAYSQYVQHWYSFKNDRINDYSMLVTSCNNAAVENISKELPLGSGILKSLKPSEDDPDETRAALQEISGLFDVSRSSDVEAYERNSVEYPDIYFSYYAQKLLNEKNAWGLVAASLGKKKNIRDFYRCVLASLRWDFYPKKDSAASRISKYQEAKKQFLAQKKVVEEMQDQIAHICDLLDEKNKWAKEEARKEMIYNQYLLEQEPGKARRETLQKEAQDRIAVKTDERNRMSARWQALEVRKEKLADEIQKGEEAARFFHQEAVRGINSIGKRPLLFGKAAYDEKLQQAQKAAADYDRQAEKQEQKNRELSLLFQKAVTESKDIESELTEAEKQLKDLGAELEERRREAAEIEQNIKEKHRDWEMAKRNLETAEREYAAQLSGVSDARVPDTAFIRELLSDDERVSTQAQAENPWFTARYNREREKLFYYAMKMNKEFILASKKCRDNFTSLAHYWGLQPGDEKERIVFHKEDRNACAAALYQTLFLLVPVISTTFASVGTFLKDIKESKAIGTLIVDEAGQAQPQMAVGALYRSRKAVIVGDPKQVEPVVTDDLKLLKKGFDDPDLRPYISGRGISVQSCADAMNVFGTYLNNPEHPDFPDWIGCPLLVHRRCISPMYEISNTLSYNGIMKQKTLQPGAKLEETFIYGKSQWIQTVGKEKGNKNHFVAAQAERVCEMLEAAFHKNEFPSLYIISPFTTVVSGMRSYIRKYKRNHPTAALARSERLDEWILRNIGTVHTFQGKEANEVILLLGCDGSKGAAGAVRWVNSNIINVAATRAKFRLYIVGDASVWSANENLQTAKNILDTFAIKEIQSILTDTEMDDARKAEALDRAAQGLPSVTAFPVEETEGENGETDYSVDTGSLADGLQAYHFMKQPLTPKQLNKFGFSDQEAFFRISPGIRKNLELGMRLYYFLQPVYAVNKDFDASCCAILFCKALELQMKECFREGMQAVLQDFEIRGKGKGREKVKLGNARPGEFMLGTFQYIIGKNASVLGLYMKQMQEGKYDSKWWIAFEEKLSICINKRNQCCHDGLFRWKDLSQLLAGMFLESGSSPKLSGLMFESEAGKRLKNTPC